MAARPRQFALSWQFSLRTLLCVTAPVALFYALRLGYLMTAFDLDETIERARNVPTLLTLAAALLAMMNSPRTRLSSAISGAILGAAVGSLSCLALAIEFGESLRRIDCWNWWKDWPLVAPYFIVATAQGGAIGAFVLQFGHLLRYLFMKRRAKTPARSSPAL